MSPRFWYGWSDELPRAAMVLLWPGLVLGTGVEHVDLLRPGGWLQEFLLVPVSFAVAAPILALAAGGVLQQRYGMQRPGPRAPRSRVPAYLGTLGAYAFGLLLVFVVTGKPPGSSLIVAVCWVGLIHPVLLSATELVTKAFMSAAARPRTAWMRAVACLIGVQGLLFLSLMGSLRGGHASNCTHSHIEMEKITEAQAESLKR